MKAPATDSSGDARRIDLEAADWLVKHDRGFTAAEQDAFFQWLAADPHHGEWLARHRQSWRALDLLAQWRPEHSTEPNPDLLARRARRGFLSWRWTGVFAAAAVLALLVTAVWPPADVAAPPPPAATPPAPAPAVATAYERRVLEDGSVIELNRGAAVMVAFTPGERRVTLLQGEAQFSVAKNHARPFIVHARGVDVRAVGTAFNVRLDQATVEVLVTEGRVELGGSAAAPAHRAAPPPLVSAGQRATVALTHDTPPQIASATPDEISRALAWQPQLLDFSSAPLSRVIEEFNRRNRVQLVLTDAELAPLPIVASIRSDNIDGLVRLLAATANLEAEHRGADEIVLHAKR